MSDTKNEETGGEEEITGTPSERPSSRSSSKKELEPNVDAPSGDLLVGDTEEDDETWTNQPSDGSDAPSSSSGTREASDSDDDDGEDEEEDDDEESHAPVPRKLIQNGKDVLCEELPARAERAKLRMRPHLAGAFVVELSNSGEKFMFDWRGEDAKVSPFKGEVVLATADSADPSRVECVISISEQNLMAVRSGDLNPQVAMLADKIRVKGRMGPAVYLFNLIAPRERQ